MGKRNHAVVTGGAGFIGSHLTEILLDRGCSVTVLDNFSTGRLDNLKHLIKNPNLRIEKVDIAEKSGNLEKYFKSVDWVFHLAALADIVPSINRPRDYHHANVEGTFNVLEAARLSRVKKFVYAASSSCYGIPDKYPTPETAQIRPQYPYALTKYLAECLVLHWEKVYKLPAISLRFFNVYGPRSRTGGTYGAVIGTFLAQKLADKPFTVVGDGNQKRDFIFVKDLVRACIKAAESDISGEIFNVGAGRAVSINHLVELLGGKTVHIPKRPGEPDITLADIRKIRKQLGWKPEITFEQGIKIVLENIDYWKNAPVWTPAAINKATRTWFKYLS